MKQQNNHVDDNHLYVLPKFQTKNQKLLLSYVPHFIFVVCFIATFARGKKLSEPIPCRAQTSIRTFSTDPSSTCGVRVGGSEMSRCISWLQTWGYSSRLC